MSITVFVLSDVRWKSSSLYNKSSHLIALFFNQKDAITYLRFQNMDIGRQPPLFIQEALLHPSGDLEPVDTYY